MPRGVSLYDEARLQGRLWTPALLRGSGYLQGWWDAADLSTITMDSSFNVSKWADKSGLGRDATVNASNYPVWGPTKGPFASPGMDFSNGELHPASAPTDNSSICVVLTPSSAAAFSVYKLVTYTKGAGLYSDMASTSTWGTYGGGDKTASTALATQPQILFMQGDAGASSGRFWLNGKSDGTYSASQGNSIGLIGGASFSQAFDGVICDLLWLSEGIPDRVRQLVEGYAFWKRKIITPNAGINLGNGNHPFSLRPPLIGD